MGDKLLGKTLGEFEILEFIGRGRTGRVYKAVQKQLNRKVALKVFEEGLFTLDDLKQRFQREAEYIAQLEHPNIVPVYAAGQVGEYSFFAMRLIDGSTLEALLEKGVALAEGAGWLADIAGALHYAHQRGLIHRDVKPGNILISGGAGMLVDFGVARLMDTTTITSSGAFVGTPLYFSPEQAKQLRATEKSDLFALGIILYEVLTGRHPFKPLQNPAPGKDEVIARIAAGAYPPPQELVPGLPAKAADLVARLLAVDPAGRPTAGEAKRELQGLAGDPALRRLKGSGA